MSASHVHAAPVLKLEKRNWTNHDYRITSLVAVARTLWLRGDMDRAARVAQQSIEEGVAFDQPISVCISLLYSAAVYLWRGDWLAADRLIARALAESQKHSLRPYHALWGRSR